jgi:hypothetical protein
LHRLRRRGDSAGNVPRSRTGFIAELAGRRTQRRAPQGTRSTSTAIRPRLCAAKERRTDSSPSRLSVLGGRFCRARATLHSKAVIAISCHRIDPAKGLSLLFERLPNRSHGFDQEGGGRARCVTRNWNRRCGRSWRWTWQLKV